MEFVENATDFKLPIFYMCPMDFDFVKIYENFCKKKNMELNFLYALAWSKNYTTLDFLSILNDYDFGILRKRYVLA